MPSHCLRALVGALLLVSCLTALSRDARAQKQRNVQLLGTFNKYASTGYNDIWAFTADNGKEYCLLGVRNGISYLDCSNPAAPKELAFYRGTGSSTWRDIKTFGGYAYCVTERRSEGMMIIDLRNPDQPRLVKFWKTSPDYRNCHNIAMDFERGHAYLSGTSRGLYVLDVKTDPENPKVIGQLSSPYQHDVTVQDGLMHGCDIYGNYYRIYDVSNPAAIRELGNIQATGQRYFHNTWPTRDNQVCVGTNESAFGPVSFFDIRNTSAPKLVATYRANASTAPSAIPHNAHVRDRVAHISYYTEGFRCLDISDAANPVEVGYYDTWPGSSGGYNGNWGATPALDSGNVYVSDISSGLYIVRPRAATAYYGKSTANKGGGAPQIGSYGAPFLGNTNFAMELWDARANSAALCLLGGKRASLDAAGLTLNVDLASPAPIILTMATDKDGGAMQALPIPSDSNLTNLKLKAQFVVLDKDSSAALGFTGTKGAEFELFAR